MKSILAAVKRHHNSARMDADNTNSSSANDNLTRTPRNRPKQLHEQEPQSSEEQEKQQMKSTPINFTPRRFSRSDNVNVSKSSLGTISNKGNSVGGSKMAKHHNVSRTSAFDHNERNVIIKNDNKYKYKDSYSHNNSVSRISITPSPCKESINYTDTLPLHSALNIHIELKQGDLVAYEYINHHDNNNNKSVAWEWGLGTVAGVVGLRLVQLLKWKKTKQCNQQLESEELDSALEILTEGTLHFEEGNEINNDDDDDSTSNYDDEWCKHIKEIEEVRKEWEEIIAANNDYNDDDDVNNKTWNITCMESTQLEQWPRKKKQMSVDSHDSKNNSNKESAKNIFKSFDAIHDKEHTSNKIDNVINNNNKNECDNNDETIFAQKLHELIGKQAKVERKIQEINKAISLYVVKQHVEAEVRRTAALHSSALLKKASNQLSLITEGDWRELRVYVNPPATVQLVVQATLELLNEPHHDDWSVMVLVLRHHDFAQRLMDFSGAILHNHSDSKQNRYLFDSHWLRRFRKHYINHPRFSYYAAMQSSRAVGALQRWVMAVYNEIQTIKLNMSANTKKITNKQKENTNTNSLSDASAVKAQQGESNLSAVPKLSSENEHSVHNSSNENEQSRQSHSFMEMFASSFAKPISHKNVAANKDNKNSNNNDEMEVCLTLQTELDALHKELMNIVKEKDELLAIHDAKEGTHYVTQEENENNELAHLMQSHKENWETSLRDDYNSQKNVSRHIAPSQSKVPENDNVDRNTISQFINKTPLNFENNSTNNNNKPLNQKSKNFNEKKEDTTSAQRKYIVPTANEILHDAASHVHSLTTNSFVVLRSSILINYSLPNAFTLTLTPSQANELVEIARARRSLSFLEEEEDENKDNINKQEEEEKLKVKEVEEQLEANRLQNMNAYLQNKIKCLETELSDAKNKIAELDLLLNTNKNHVINIKEADENYSRTEDILYLEVCESKAKSRNVNNKNFVVNDNIENSNKNNKGNLESMKQVQIDEVNTPNLSESINDTIVANENFKNGESEQQKPYASLTTQLSEWHTPTSLFPNNFDKICSVDNKNNNNNIILTTPIPFKSSPELEWERQQRDHTSALTEESKENTIDETTGEQIPALSSTEIVEPQKRQIYRKTSKTEESSQNDKKDQIEEKNRTRTYPTNEKKHNEYINNLKTSTDDVQMKTFIEYDIITNVLGKINDEASALRHNVLCAQHTLQEINNVIDCNNALRTIINSVE